MATSYIRPSGLGDYTAWSAWAADGVRAPGDIGIQDEAGTQTDAIVLPALAGLRMRFEADVRIEHDYQSALTIDTGTTGLVIEADAGHLLTLAQTGGGVVPALEYGAASGWSATNVRCEAGSTAVQGPAVSSGAVRCSNFTALATGTAWACSRMEDVVFEDVTLRGDGVALRCNTWAGRMERVVLRGGYPWAPYAFQCGWCGDAEMLSVDLRCTDIGGGICAWNVDRSTIAVGTTVRIANVNLIGATAQTLASDYGLYLASTPGGTLEIRNLQIKGFAIPWRTTSTADGHDYCNVPGVPLNGVAPADDLYPNKAWLLGANDLSVDPQFVDELAEDYRLGTGSPCLGVGYNTGVVYDVNGVAYASPMPIGAYAAADDVAPYVDDATATSIATIVVDFSEAVYGADLETAGAWVITARDGGDVPSLSSVVADVGHEFVTITVSGMRSSGQYTVEAPATIRDAALNPIGVRTADFDAPDVITPTVLTVVLESAASVLVTFSESVQGASLEVATAWTCVAGDLLADAPAITAAAQIAGDHVRLTISGALTPGGLYTVTCPADTEDLAGNVIATADRDGNFAYLTFGAPPDEEGLLEAITGAVGGEIARLQGSPTTRLTASLAPGDTVAHVESTLHCPASGEVWIEGERVPYTSRTGTQFLGLTRETVIDPADSITKPIRFVTLQPGTPVRCATRGYSLKDQARNSLFVTTSTGLDLDAIARDRGYPRPIGLMSDASTQDYVCERYYQDAGTRRSVFATLAAMFQWGNITGTDGVAVDGQTLAITTTASRSKLQDRYCYVGDNLCRVVNATVGVGGKTNLNLEPAAGPFWQAPGITTGQADLTYRLLPFRLKVQLLGRSGTLVKAANLWIHLYLPVTSIPATYLIANGTTDTPADGRPIGGQALENGHVDRNATMPGPPPYAANRHPIYLVNPYAAVTRAIIEDIVPAGTVVRVVSGLP